MRHLLSNAALVLAMSQPLPGHGQEPAPPVQKIGRTAAESSGPQWPKSPEAPKAAPNVLLILTDDAGFGASSTFGGPVPTPNFDALAARGLRYNQYNNTPICSATRAALLTGRNEHNVGMGGITNTPTGYPGYTTVIPKSAGSVAEILRQNGFLTAAFGKWHLIPEWEDSPVGPFDRWPTGMGFSYYYGFLGGDTNQWAPALVENTTPIEPPHDDPEYILDRDLADHAVEWLKRNNDIAPDKRFFLYYATGSTHSPHAAPRKWIERFRGRFDAGWDAMREETFARQKAAGIIPADARLTPRPASLPAWKDLSLDARRLAARMMEAYAGQMAYADSQIGRLLDELRAEGKLDNTLVIFIQGDNGASAEGTPTGVVYEQSMINGYRPSIEQMIGKIDDIGGPKASSNYPAGWGWAMNTPFQYYKQIGSHLGGVRNGMVISWPDRIKAGGEIRSQFHYVTDVLPTILEATGVQAPATLNGVPQQKIDGISMAYSFDANGASHRTTQVFEMVRNLGIYSDGWWAGTRPTDAPWDFFNAKAGVDPDKRVWELYDIRHDYSQAHDLAAARPSKLAEMKALFWSEAGKNNILPIHGTREGSEGRPTVAGPRKTYSFRSLVSRIPAGAVPDTLGHSFRIDAAVTLGSDRGNGVLVTQGGRFGGYAFYMKDGYLVFHYNAVAEKQYKVRSSGRIAAGEHRLTATFQADAATRGSGGTLVLAVDGREIARGRIEHTLPINVSIFEGFDIGRDTLTPISDDYDIPGSRFSGGIHKVDFTIDPDAVAARR